MEPRGYPPLTAGYDDPDKVHGEVVTPEVVGFGPAVCQALVIVVEHAGRVVEDVAVDLARGYDGLEGVAERVLGGDEPGDEEGERAPAYLRAGVRFLALYVGYMVEGNGTYGCHGLHAENERVRRQVPRVGQGVFFPQLPEQILRRPHARVVVREVPYARQPRRMERRMGSSVPSKNKWIVPAVK